jgi:hypothetical protein
MKLKKRVTIKEDGRFLIYYEAGPHSHPHPLPQEQGRGDLPQDGTADAGATGQQPPQQQ